MGFSTARAAGVVVAVGVAMGLLGGRVAYLQTYGREVTIRKAEEQQHQTVALAARRGCVFDRNGMLMAGTMEAHTLFVDPVFREQLIEEGRITRQEADAQAAALAQAVDLPAEPLMDLLNQEGSRRYIKLVERMDDAAAGAVSRLEIDWAGTHPVPVRNYPMGSLAAHVLGGVGKGGVGLEGVELKYNGLLSGQDGMLRQRKDARRRPISVAASDYVEPRHGRHLILTIDANIQMILEQELNATCKRQKARRGEGVVIDPNTGEVLALANWPTYNPGVISEVDAFTRTNHALVSPYEPGSTIKPFIVGPALAAGLTRPGEVFPIGGKVWRTAYGRRITDVHGYDQLAMWDVLVKSSNVGMAMLATRMGNPRIHEAITGFGFGSTTGLELPFEDDGRVNPLPRWGKYTTHSVAQGYELMVTPIQLARAMSTYANGGRLIKPTLIKGTLNADGTVERAASPLMPQMTPQVIDPMTAADVRRILADVMVRGTGSRARSQTWNVFGKTGTAHISDARGGYDNTRYTSSFVGGAPLENPRLVIAFIIHEPDRSLGYFGGTISAPGAVAVLERSLAYLQAQPSPDMPLPPPQVAAVLHNYSERVYQRKAGSTASASVQD